MKGKLDQLAEENMGQFLTQEQCVQPTPHTGDNTFAQLIQILEGKLEEIQKIPERITDYATVLDRVMIKQASVTTEHLESLFA